MPNIWELCKIEADMKDMVSGLQTDISLQGNKIWTLPFSVEISFKGTKMQARLRWKNEVRSHFLCS
jgi:hypothetical protein